MRTIPIIDQRNLIPSLADHARLAKADEPLRDGFDRPLQDLLISVTDRCNFRGDNAMSRAVFGSDFVFSSRTSLLSFEEISRLARQFAAQGIQRIHLSGGEPLLRKQLEKLVAQLAVLQTPEGVPLVISLTTNGSLLAPQAQSLRDAGLGQLTVNLDALDEDLFRHINGTDFPVSGVLAGLAAADAAGFSGIKVNMLVKRGTNEQEILPMAHYFQGTGTTLQFLEYMGVNANHEWCLDQVLTSTELVHRIDQVMPLVALTPDTAGELVERWGYVGTDGQYNPQMGEIGIISNVFNPFCGACNRARLSTEGQLQLCLFANVRHDLRSLVRKPNDVTDAQIQEQIAKIWRTRTDRYSEILTTELFTARANRAQHAGTNYIGD